MNLFDKQRKTGVAVWSYEKQRFIDFVPCPGEKRVRIDAYDGIHNYAVYAVRYGKGRMVFPIEPVVPLTDWEIDLT